jgi:Uma2 family endonuclease
VVEIVFERSLGRDRGEKFEEYEAAGIAEYWLLDLQREWIELYQLDEAGRYRWSSAEWKESITLR